MSPVFIDTNVPMYAAGQAHPLREPARRLILEIAAGELDAVTDAEVFQEILHRYLHIGRKETGLRVFDTFARVMDGRVLPVTMREMETARQLAAEHALRGARDLIHAAVMLEHGIRDIVSADRDFDHIDGIRRLRLE